MKSQRRFKMGKWTMQCALFDVIMQLCHVIQNFDGFSFIVICAVKHLAVSFFIFIQVLNHQKSSSTKRHFVSLLPKRTRWNVFKMTKIWSMNRPKKSEWMQFPAHNALAFVEVIWSAFVASETIWVELYSYMLDHCPWTSMWMQCSIVMQICVWIHIPFSKMQFRKKFCQQ